MRALISTIGSRGEVQPAVALAVRLAVLGHEAVVCAPPDFREWAEGFGVRYVSVGPVLRGTAKAAAGVPTPEQRQRMIDGTVAEQFRAVDAAARGCDVVVAGGALAIAARSVAEKWSLPYVYAAFAPITLPSPHHAPPVFGMLGDQVAERSPEALWEADRERWNLMWSAPLNAHRAALGLPPVEDVRRHLFTETPWLAADPVLAPWPGAPDLEVFQTGAWLLDQPAPLAADLEKFLDAGDPPVYLGFGSARAPHGIADAVVAAAGRLGLRTVVAAGWADLSVTDPDCLVVGEVDQRALFRRVAAVIHHGGAGTTTTAAASGAPQVIVPQMFDQPYFASRVADLGIGVAIREEPTEAVLTEALSTAVGRRSAARELTESVETAGVTRAARALVASAAGRDHPAGNGSE